MNFWDYLLGFLGYRRIHHVTFQAENDLIESLSEMAVQERRPQEQVATELLMQAVALHKAAGIYWQNWETLSQREQQVAALICLNYTNRQVAAHLGISNETVKTHMHHILAKFDLHNRSELRQALASWDFSAWDK